MSRRSRKLVRGFITLAAAGWGLALTATVIIYSAPNINDELQWLLVVCIHSAVTIMTVISGIMFVLIYVTREVANRQEAYRMGLDHGACMADSLHHSHV